MTNLRNVGFRMLKLGGRRPALVTSSSLRPEIHQTLPSNTLRAWTQTFGIERVDHLVGNVFELMPEVERLAKLTGFHEFAEFTAEDVGTVDSGLNSVRGTSIQNLLY